MKSIIVAAALLVALGLLGYKAHESLRSTAVHNAYVAGCSSAAESIFSMLGIGATPQQISESCSTLATQEGY